MISWWWTIPVAIISGFVGFIVGIYGGVLLAAHFDEHGWMAK